MSVLIKGMELPKSPGVYELRLYVDSDDTVTVEGAYGCFEGEPFEAITVPTDTVLENEVHIIDTKGKSNKDADYWRPIQIPEPPKEEES